MVVPVGPRLAMERMLERHRAAPGVAVVVLGAGAKMRRERLAVNVDLLVALAPPGGNGVHHREGVADVNALALGLEVVPVPGAATAVGVEGVFVPPGRVEVH